MTNHVIRQAKMSDFYTDKINLGVHHFINNNYLVVKENKDDTFLKIYIRSKLKYAKDASGVPIPIIIDEEDYKLIEDFRLTIYQDSFNWLLPAAYTTPYDKRTLHLQVLELPVKHDRHAVSINGNRFDCRKENILYGVDYEVPIGSPDYVALRIRKVTNKDHTQMFFTVAFDELSYFSITELGEEEALKQAIEKEKILRRMYYITRQNKIKELL